ncbi:MAG TPA: hypothetical protein VJC11_01765, partial [Patescibacteria group bacterium]|nr:hypothetical protein [Patescibacteria group bacterium]
MSEISRHFIAYLVAAALFGIFAFYLLLSNRKVRIVREFAMLQLSLGVFSGVTVLMYVWADLGVQLILQRILFFLALGITGVFLLFARDAANLTGRVRTVFSGVVFVALTIFGVTAFFDWIWPQQGLYPLIVEWAGTAMSAAIAITACIFGFSFWRHETTMTRERLKILFVASLAVFIGSLVYASRWAADDVMRSVVFLGFYGGASALGVYALRRHRIVEFGEVIRKSLVWIAVSGLLFLFLYFFLAIFRLWVLRQDVTGFLIAFSFLFLLT